MKKLFSSLRWSEFVLLLNLNLLANQRIYNDREPIWLTEMSNYEPIRSTDLPHQTCLV